jgi:hypothetical protein
MIETIVMELIHDQAESLSKQQHARILDPLYDPKVAENNTRIGDDDNVSGNEQVDLSSILFLLGVFLFIL